MVKWGHDSISHKKSYTAYVNSDGELYVQKGGNLTLEQIEWAMIWRARALSALRTKTVAYEQFYYGFAFRHGKPNVVYIPRKRGEGVERIFNFLFGKDQDVPDVDSCFNRIHQYIKKDAISAELNPVSRMLGIEDIIRRCKGGNAGMNGKGEIEYEALKPPGFLDDLTMSNEEDSDYHEALWNDDDEDINEAFSFSNDAKSSTEDINPVLQLVEDDAYREFEEQQIEPVTVTPLEKESNEPFVASDPISILFEGAIVSRTQQQNLRFKCEPRPVKVVSNIGKSQAVNFKQPKWVGYIRMESKPTIDMKVLCVDLSKNFRTTEEIFLSSNVRDTNPVLFDVFRESKLPMAETLFGNAIRDFNPEIANKVNVLPPEICMFYGPYICADVDKPPDLKKLGVGFALFQKGCVVVKIGSRYLGGVILGVGRSGRVHVKTVIQTNSWEMAVAVLDKVIVIPNGVVYKGGYSGKEGLTSFIFAALRSVWCH